MTEFVVQQGDVTAVPSDLLLLKHAQYFYGADRAVMERLVAANVCRERDLQPAPGDSVVVETHGAIAPKRVLFLGTPSLASFTYPQMEVFARSAIEKIVDLGLPIQVLTTTVHGSGYGLDGGEALQRLVRGFQAGLREQGVKTVERITFLTLGKRAERILNLALLAMTPTADTMEEPAVTDRASSTDDSWTGLTPPPPTTESSSVAVPISAGATTVGKRRVFVALPFSDEFQNVYDFGIYPAVRNCGCICERVDEVYFTGDILSRIRAGIDAADIVIADLSEARPNVYLEVGYAWGKGIPVIFVARKGEKLHFDVSTHRCIYYGRFTQFAKDLEALIRGIGLTRGE